MNEDDSPPRFEYRPPIVAQDQSYKPMFDQGPIMRAAGPAVGVERGIPSLFSMSAQQQQWENLSTFAHPAPLFGDMPLKKQAPVQRKLEQHHKTMIPVITRSRREVFEQDSAASLGFSFDCDNPQEEVFAKIVSAFDAFADCKLALDGHVKGFCHLEGERCKFAGSLLFKQARWVVELQRLSGPATPLNKLINKTADVIASDQHVSQMVVSQPHSPIMSEFSAGSKASLKGNLEEQPLEQDTCKRLSDLAQSEYVEMQREGFKALASLAEDKGEEFLMVAGNEHVVNLLTCALAAHDDEVKWSGSCILKSLSNFPGFREHLAPIIDAVLDLLLVESSFKGKGVARNLNVVLERLISSSACMRVFQNRLDKFYKLKGSQDSSTRDVATLLLQVLGY